MVKRFLTKTSLWAGLALVGMLGCEDQLAPPAAQTPPVGADPVVLARPASIRVAEAPSEGLGKPAKHFALATLVDMQTQVALPNLNGEHKVTLRYRSPDGHLYVQREVSLSATEARQMSDAHPLVDLLPIAGTPIVSHGLAGTWTVEVSLDGAPASSAATFQLE